MAAPSKFVIGYGLLAKLEGSYNAGASLSTATDGVLLEELATATISYANDGARPAPPGTGGYQKRAKPSGRVVDLAVKVAPKGFGAAYSAGNTPNIHALLRACGLDGTVSTTGGAESWTYSPTPLPSGGFGSVATSLYGRGQLYPLQGLIGDWTLNIKPGEIPVVDFAMKGLAPTSFTDVSLPAITYPALSIDPPKATSINFTWSGISTLVVRSLTLKYGRQVSPRLDLNAGGHAGFAPGRRTPTLDIEIETPIIGLLDFFSLYDTGTNAAWTFTIGTVQYNKYAISGPGAQMMTAPVENKDGEVSVTKLSFQLNPSALNLSDELSWLFN